MSYYRRVPSVILKHSRIKLKLLNERKTLALQHLKNILKIPIFQSNTNSTSSIIKCIELNWAHKNKPKGKCKNESKILAFGHSINQMDPCGREFSTITYEHNNLPLLVQEHGNWLLTSHEGP
ncbi:unnamed protein product [Citrullus colocynthis]|uniref:Uncharacterized protein n=1 Tax=Citrullus colocynthis TaxID=252529 RepID=A0ABP0YVJ8_9ROSI